MDMRGDGDLYDYCADDPVSRMDPTGLAWDESLHPRDDIGRFAAAGGGSSGESGISSKTELTFSQALGSALGNVIPSFWTFGGDVAGAIMSPRQTIDGLSDIVVGYVHQAIGKDSDKRVYADAVTAYFTNRYGSMACIKDTLASDPVGFAADMSLFLTGGSGVLRSASKAASVAAKIAPVGKTAHGAAKASGIMGKTGELVGKVGNVSDPLTWVQAGVKKAAPHAMKKVQFSDKTQMIVKKIGTGVTRLKTPIGISGTQQTITGEQKK